MANGSRKRLFKPNCEEFEKIKSPTKYTKIHGVVSAVSPMQSGASGCKYGSLNEESAYKRGCTGTGKCLF